MLHYDTQTYLTMLRELTEAGKEVSLTVFGSSMFPFLTDRRDTVLFSKPKTPLQKGDIVFYQRAGGQFVLHRICEIQGGLLKISGDAQWALEPVPADRVFARVDKVCRNGRWIGPDSRIWKFFQHTWVTCLPIRRFLLFFCRQFARIRRHLKRK